MIFAFTTIWAALRAKGENAAAAAEFRRALELNLKLPQTHLALIQTLRDSGQIDEARAAAARLPLEIWPDFFEFHEELGLVLCVHQDWDGAIAALGRAVELSPRSWVGWSNLAFALESRGEYERALTCYDKAAEIAPKSRPSRPIGSTCCNARRNSRRANSKQNSKHGTGNSRSRCERQCGRTPMIALPDRPLRIGYVSPDLRRHVVGWSLLPILQQHDRQQFQIYGYSNVSRPDDLTERLREYSDRWRRIHTMDDEQASEIIRADHIDILVDLSLHTAGNRLLLSHAGRRPCK